MVNRLVDVEGCRSSVCLAVQTQHGNTATISSKTHSCLITSKKQKQGTLSLGNDFLFLPGEGRLSQYLQLQACLDDTKPGQKRL